ncbi:MAG: GTP cyclohydrolase I FolE [Sphingobacteriia bacterium]|jgi:GTP cyclohydrolase I|nr:GTP cyclohydrolase I FolE [Sphingobacteriia bacterium]
MSISILDKYLEMGDQHASGAMDTPLRPDAFELSNAEKVKRIESHFREIMLTLGLDLTDDSLSGTPYRVAKMYVEEIFSGLDPEQEPKIALFENKYNYDQMLVEKDITLYSNCEHHFVPIVGKVHVAYYSTGHVIGLSKIHRVVKYFARRPQVQERLTAQIANYISRILNTPDVAVVVDATHLCVSSRGIEDHTSSTVTASYQGKFQEEAIKNEFLRYLQL